MEQHARSSLLCFNVFLAQAKAEDTSPGLVWVKSYGVGDETSPPASAAGGRNAAELRPVPTRRRCFSALTGQSVPGLGL